MRRHEPSTASRADDLTEVFEVTHPFHPLVGQRIELLAYRHNWGEHRVMYRDEEGRMCSLPAAWTSMVAPDPYVVLSAGRSLFRPQDLVRLAARVRRLLRESTISAAEEREQESVK